MYPVALASQLALVCTLVLLLINDFDIRWLLMGGDTTQQLGLFLFVKA